MYSRVYVEITNTCNLACSFCHGTERAPKQMTLGEFARVVGSLRGLTQYLYLHVLGEPLTHPLLPVFIEYAKSNGFHTVLTTNGTLLTERGDDIIKAGVYKVNISLHCLENGYKEDYVDACLDFADKASKSGVLTVLRLWNGEGIDGDTNARVLARIKQRFSDGEFADCARGTRIRKRLHLEYGERFAWPDMSAEDMGCELFCHGLSDHFGILSDGSVIPCCLDADGKINLGNIFESDIRTVLSSDRAKAIKEGFESKKAVEEFCRRCGYARRFKI